MEVSEEGGVSEANSPQLVPTRKSNRTRFPPVWRKDYVCSSQHEKWTSPHTIDKAVTYDKCSPSQVQFALSIPAIKDPSTCHQASRDSRWLEAT